MTEEIYVNVNDFPNYQISNFGNVKNLFTRRILKPRVNTNGYFSVSLSKDGDVSNRRVHQLVADAFIENPDNKKCVDHIDRNRTNNHISNLRRATNTENSQNASMKSTNTSGVIGVSFSSSRNKWVAQIVVNGLCKGLGRFASKEDAIRVRQEAEVLYFGEFRSV